MRAVQLFNYYTREPAPEADRVRIQANIDRIQAQLDATTDENQRSGYRFSLMALRGDIRMPRG